MHKRLRSVSIAGLPCVRIAQKPEKGRWFAIIASKARNRSSMMAAKVSAFSSIPSTFNGKLGVMVAV